MQQPKPRVGLSRVKAGARKNAGRQSGGFKYANARQYGPDAGWNAISASSQLDILFVLG